MGEAGALRKRVLLLKFLSIIGRCEITEVRELGSGEIMYLPIIYPPVQEIKFKLSLNGCEAPEWLSIGYT